MGAFKFRGAFNALSQFTRAAPGRRARLFVGQSCAGDRAVGAHLLGIPATIVMPHDAPAAKVEATRGYGGEVITYDRYTEDREADRREARQERGMTLIPPYDHPHVIAGQGTAAKELFEETGPLDRLFVLPGRRRLARRLRAGGARAVARTARSIGVEPEAGNDASSRSHAARSSTSNAASTIADGAQTQHLGEYNFRMIRARRGPRRHRQRRPARATHEVSSRAHEDGG